MVDSDSCEEQVGVQMRVGIIIGHTENLKFMNPMIFANRFYTRGYDTSLIDASSIFSSVGNVYARCCNVKSPIKVGDTLSCEDTRNLKDYSLLWVFSLASRSIYTDLSQILFFLEMNTDVRFVNSPTSFLFFNSKVSLDFLPKEFRVPETCITGNPEKILSLVHEDSRERRWIIKPTAGSLGRDVYILDRKDLNINSIVEMMVKGEPNQHCVVQEFIEEISKHGEKRVIACRGKVICAYRRIAANCDFRTNLKKGAEPTLTELSKEESSLCEQLSIFYMKNNIDYIGIDLVYPCIIEINIVNPGGINTMSTLGDDADKYADEVIDIILRSFK